MLAHAVPFEGDAVGIVDDPVEYGIGDGGFAERFMMLLSWKGSYCNLAL